MWGRLDPQQPPEVLRVPLQQLCLTTKATLVAAEQETGAAGAGPAGLVQAPFKRISDCMSLLASVRLQLQPCTACGVAVP
jgi:hypothetical protein